MKSSKISIKNIVIAITLPILIVLLIAFLYIGFLFSNVNRVSISRANVVKSDVQYLNSDLNVINLCLIGSDQYSSSEVSADSIMILTIDKENHKVKLSSLMRDMYVTNPLNSQKFNLNEAILTGGYELLLKTINENFNLNVDKFVSVNLSSFPKIIDILGGINVNLTEYEVSEINKFIEIIDSNNGTSTAKITYAGTHLLDGTQVSAYLRIRAEDGRDTVRTEHQREVVSYILDNLNKESISNLVYNAGDIISLITTNLKTSEIISTGISLLTSGINGIEQMRFPLDGEFEMLTTSDEKFHLIIDSDSISEQLNNFIYSVD